MNETLEDFADVKPYLRSAVALAIFLRSGMGNKAAIADCYATADLFLAHLEQDLGSTSADDTAS